MSASTACPNGRPRKQLSDQLDRLDGILDVLADALPEAVRDAVRDGMADAARALLTQALADPAALTLLRHAVAPVDAPVVAPSRRAAFLARCKAAAAAVRTRAASVAGKAAELVLAGIERVNAFLTSIAAKANSVRRVCRVAWHLKRAAAVAAGVGVAVGVVSLASHPVATCLSGVGAALTAFAVQAGLWCRRAVRPWLA